MSSEYYDLASTMYAMFTAYVIAGFTESQALVLVSNFLNSQTTAARA